jgi:hypothetical protein
MIKLRNILSEIRLINKNDPSLNNENLFKFLDKHIREFALSEIHREGSKVAMELVTNSELNLREQYPQLQEYDIEEIEDIDGSIRNEIIQKMVEYLVEKGLMWDGGDEDGKESITWGGEIGLSYSVEHEVGEDDGSYEWGPIHFKGYDFAKLSYDI